MVDPLAHDRGLDAYRRAHVGLHGSTPGSGVHRPRDAGTVGTPVGRGKAGSRDIGSGRWGVW